MKWAAYKRFVRGHPREALEADLLLSVVGIVIIVIIVIGGVIAVGGFQPPVTGNAPATPIPGVADFIFWIGAFVVAVGLSLVILNIVLFVGGRRRRRTCTPERGPIEPT